MQIVRRIDFKYSPKSVLSPGDMFAFVWYIAFLSAALSFVIASQYGQVYSKKNSKYPKGKSNFGISTTRSESLSTSDEENKRSNKVSLSDGIVYTTLPTSTTTVPSTTPVPRTTTEPEIPAAVSHPTVNVHLSSPPVDHDPTSDSNVQGFATSLSAYHTRSASALPSLKKEHIYGILKDTKRLSKQTSDRLVNSRTSSSYVEIIGASSSHVSDISQRHSKHSTNRRSLTKSSQIKSIRAGKIDLNTNSNKSILSEASDNMYTRTVNLHQQRNGPPYEAPNDRTTERKFPSESQRKTKQLIVGNSLRQRPHSRAQANYPPRNNSFRSEIGRGRKQQGDVVNVYERFLSAVSRMSISEPLPNLSTRLNGSQPGADAYNDKEFRVARRRSHSQQHSISKSTMTKTDAGYYGNARLSLSDVTYINTHLKHNSELVSLNISNYLAPCGEIARSATAAVKVMKGLLAILPGVTTDTADSQRRSRSVGHHKEKLDYKVNLKKREQIIIDLLLLYSKCMHGVRHSGLPTYSNDITSDAFRNTIIDTLFPLEDARPDDLGKVPKVRTEQIVGSELSTTHNTLGLSDHVTIHSATMNKDSVIKQMADVEEEKTDVKGKTAVEEKASDVVGENIDIYHWNESGGGDYSKVGASQHQRLKHVEVHVFTGNKGKSSNFRHKYPTILAQFRPEKTQHNLVHSSANGAYGLSYKFGYKKERKVPRISTEIASDGVQIKHYGRPGETETVFQMQERNNFKYHTHPGRHREEGAKTNNIVDSAQKRADYDGEDVSAENIQNRYAVVSSGDELNTMSLVSTQIIGNHQGDTDTGEDPSDVEYTKHSQHSKDDWKFTNEIRINSNDEILTGDFQNSSPEYKKKNAIANKRYDDRKHSQMSAQRHFEVHVLAENGALETDEMKEPRTLEVHSVSTQPYERDMDTRNDVKASLYLGFGSVTGLQYNSFDDLRGEDHDDEEHSYSSFKLHALPAQEDPVSLDVVENMDHTHHDLKDGAKHMEHIQRHIKDDDNLDHTDNNLNNPEDIPYNNIFPATDVSRTPVAYNSPRHARDNNDTSPGSGNSAFLKRVKRSIALSFDKPSTASSLPSSSVETSPTSATSHLLTSAPSFVSTVNSPKKQSHGTSPASSQLSTELPSSSKKFSTTSIQVLDSPQTEPSRTTAMKQVVQAKPMLNIGVIISFDTKFPWAINKTRPAIEMAAETVTSSTGSLSGFDIQIVYRDSKCSHTFGPLEAIDLYVKRLAHVFIGPVCDYSIAPLARLTYYWGTGGIPILTAGALVEAFANKAEFRLLTRVQVDIWSLVLPVELMPVLIS